MSAARIRMTRHLLAWVWSIGSIEAGTACWGRIAVGIHLVHAVHIVLVELGLSANHLTIIHLAHLAVIE